MTAGKKKARTLGARFIQSKKGTIGIEVAFKTDEGLINWVGWLSEAAAERTMATLTDVLGFNGDDTLKPGTSQLKSESLDLKREVELDIQPEVYEGKERLKVAWVNLPGMSAGFEALTPEVVQGTLKSIGFKALYLAHKGEGGPVVAKPPVIEESDVPF